MSVSRANVTSRTAVASRTRVTGRGGVPSSSNGTSDPIITAGPVASPIGETTATITWTVDQFAQGWIEYGLTASYGSETTHETSYSYKTHTQSVTGLVAGTLYHYRVRGQNSGAQTYTGSDQTFTTVAAAATITYTDSSLVGVTTHGGFTIDPTGVVDSTAGLNSWIAAQANGTNATNRRRYVFPPTATYKITTGLCIGDKTFVTIWGHAAADSAWMPDRTLPDGSTSAYGTLPAPGCTISFSAATGSNARSAFVVGSGYVGNNSITYARTCTDVVIRGFNLNGNSPTPGIFNASFETVNAFEIGKATGLEVCYNKVWNVPGDLARTRGDSRVCDNVWVHHNWAVDLGRNGFSAVEGNTQLFEHNVVDRCGYYGFDAEPDDDTTLAFRVLDNVTVRYNTYGSFGSAGVAGTFAAIGCGTHTHMADITVTGNAVTGSTYDAYITSSKNRNLTAYAGQHIANSGAAGADPHIQRLTFTNNGVTHGLTVAGPVFHAGGVDTLVVTGNDTNLSSGSFASLGPHDSLYFYTPTSVTNTGNT